MRKLFLITVTVLLWLIILELGSRIIVALKFVPLDKNNLLLYHGPTVQLPQFSKKQPQTYRIFVYGGSTTEGAHLPRIGYVEQLRLQFEKMISVPVEVFNLGFSAFTSTDDRFLIERTLRFKPDLIIIYTSHNEFIFTESLPYYSYVLSKIEGLTMLKVGSWIVDDFRVRNPNFTIAAPQNPQWYQERTKIFIQNMTSIVNMAKLNNIPVLLVTAVSNLSDWPPSSEENLYNKNDWDIYKNDEKELMQWSEKDKHKALLVADNMTRKYPNSAHFIFLRGKIFEQLGKFTQAYSDYLKAKDLDIVPYRALSIFNEFVRSLRNNRTVFVSDAESYFNKNAKNSLVGYDLIIDNVHLTTKGKYLMTRSIIDTIQAHGVILEKYFLTNAAPMSLDEILSRISLASEESYSELLNTALYVIKPPFLNYDRAEFVLDQALQIRESDWKLWVTKATVSAAKRNIAQAKEELQLAYSLRGETFDLNNYRDIPSLGYVYSRLPSDERQVLGVYVISEQ